MISPKVVMVFNRRHTADKTHKGSIEVRITLGKKQKFIATGVSVLPHQWKGGNPFVGGYLTAPEDNRVLVAILQKVSRIIAEMVESGNIDINAIPTLLKRNSENITFLQYVFGRMQKKNVTNYTLKSYKVFYNKLCEFGRIKFFTDVNEKNIRAFDEWLQNYSWIEKDKYGRDCEKHYSQPTIGSYHKNMKNFIADALVDGYLSDNVYITKKIKIDKGAPRIDKFLTIEELEKIKTADMPTRSLNEARDLFVFACETGLSYADLMEFDASKVREEGGLRLYSGKRHKTNIEYTCVVTQVAMAILEKYGSSLPKLPNQKYNVKLKLVADAAGIDKPISSHYARHTAGMVWLNSGIPVEVVSRCLGHSNLQMTQKAYAKILDKTIVNAFSKVAIVK